MLSYADTQYSQLSTQAWGHAGDTLTYFYDANGSLVYKIYADVSTAGDPAAIVAADTGLKYDKSEYNLQNRLSKLTQYSIVGSDTVRVFTEYTYNPDGIRVGSYTYKTVNGGAAQNKTTTDYLIDPYNHTGYAQVLEEWTISYNASDVPTTQNRISYTIGDDVISQSRSDWTWNAGTSTWDLTTSHDTEYLLYDGQGSTRQLARPDKTVIENYSYDSYGIMLGGNPTPAAPAATKLLYTGEQFDAAAQSYYLRARYYDPMNGRFTQTDPFGGNVSDPQSLHKYTYVHNNPINAIDPGGEEYTAVETLTVGAIMSQMMAAAFPYVMAGIMTIITTTVILTLLPIVQAMLFSGIDYMVKAAILLMSKLKEYTEAAKGVLKDIASTLKKSLKELSKMKIFPVPQILMPFIFAHTVSCLIQRPDWFILTYNGKGSSRTGQNRWEVLKDLPRLLTSWSHDEFPYASTLQGGKGAMTAEVPLLENCIQGGMLGAFYRWVCKGTITNFLVVPIPMYVKGKS